MLGNNHIGENLRDDSEFSFEKHNRRILSGEHPSTPIYTDGIDGDAEIDEDCNYPEAYS